MVSRLLAHKYLWKKKKNSFINIISYLAIIAFIVGSAVVVIVMSTFNGFEELLVDHLATYVNPDLEILPTKTKYIKATPQQFNQLSRIEGVSSVSGVLEETVLFENENVRQVAKLRGVPADYFTVDTLHGPQLSERTSITPDRIILHQTLMFNLGLDPDQPFAVVNSHLPNRDFKPLPGRQPLLKKSYSLSAFYISPSGLSDGPYGYCNLQQLASLLGLSNQYTSIEVSIDDGYNLVKTKEKVNEILASHGVEVLDSFEQEASTYKLLRVEKWMGFVITMLIMLLILFNLMACLWMIAMEKQKDIAILKSMGLQDSKVFGLFIRLGIYYSLLGGGIGLIIGMVIVLLQDTFGLVPMNDGFMTTYYPVQLKVLDIFVVAIALILLGILAALPAAYLAKHIKTDFRRV